MGIAEDATKTLKAGLKVEPVCPYCGGDPLDLQAVQANIGLIPVYVYFCGNMECRKVFNVVSMPPMPKLPGGRVVVPGFGQSGGGRVI